MLDKHTLKDMILDNKDISNVDYSHIKDMSYMFEGERYLREIPKLDTSNVTNMEGMFEGCVNFNSDISDWDVSNVTNMYSMFYNCKNFNQNLNSWDVSNVENMAHLFHHCRSFNQPLDKWNVSNVTNMQGMFLYCSNFNQEINNWDVGSVTDMSFMFGNALLFNKPLDKWNVDNVTNAIVMFYIPEITEETLNCIFEKLNNDTPLTQEELKTLENYGIDFPTEEPLELFNQSLIPWKLLEKTRVVNMFNNGDKFIKHFGVEKSIHILCSTDYIDEFSKQTLITNIGNGGVKQQISKFISRHLIR